MKKLILVVLILLFASPVLAERYCMWDGSKGINCQNDNRGYIRRPDGLPVGGGVMNYNDNGFYLLVVTEPTVGADQVKETEQWSFVADEIGLTWTVRDLTTEEIDQREASAMSVNDFWQWKAIQLAGGWTNTQIENALPPELVEAWLARKRLEQ